MKAGSDICLVLHVSVMEDRVVSLSCPCRMIRKWMTKCLLLLDNLR